jgi:hypothetical protein
VVPTHGAHAIAWDDRSTNNACAPARDCPILFVSAHRDLRRPLRQLGHGSSNRSNLINPKCGWLDMIAPDERTGESNLGMRAAANANRKSAERT